MNQKTIQRRERQLRERRRDLFEQVAETEADLQFIADDRESELEERAQEERAARLFARLDLRGKHEIEEIDAALQRIANGTYGACTQCGRNIKAERLRALPATPYCIGCARARETGLRAEEGEEPEPEGRWREDAGLPPDRDLEAQLREQVGGDERIDTEELRIVCRHGVVHLDGAVPSEAERQMVLKHVTDVAGLQNVVDRLRVKEILWESESRSKAEAGGGEEPPGYQDAPTDDVFRTQEEGLDFVPPVDPPADEEE
jgi:RNA polymerase-binding protein DksA